MKKAIFILMSLLLLAGCEKYETDTYGKYKKVYFHDDENMIFYDGRQIEGDTDITEEKIESLFGLNSEGSDHTSWSVVEFNYCFEYFKDKNGYYYKNYKSESGGYAVIRPPYYQFQINNDGSVIWEYAGADVRGNRPITFMHKYGNLYIEFPYLDPPTPEMIKTKTIPSSTLRPLLITNRIIIMEMIKTIPYLCYVRVKLIKESN